MGINTGEILFLAWAILHSIVRLPNGLVYPVETALKVGNYLGLSTEDFVEMHPHGARNYCCGGGGGLASTGDYGQMRITVGKKKAEQIRQTGAKIVATNCFNCMTQIRDLNNAYELGIDVKSIVELVAETLKT